MKFPLVLLTFFLFGCALRTGYTVFLKQEDIVYMNDQGENCVPSGFQLNDDGHHLTTWFGNCKFRTIRTLEDYEIKQWKPEKGPKQ